MFLARNRVIPSSSGVEILHMLSISVSTPDEVYAYAKHIQSICILSIKCLLLVQLLGLGQRAPPIEAPKGSPKAG